MKTSDYKSDLYKRLKSNPEYALGYLNLALSDEDPKVLLLAVKDIIEAKSSISKIAKSTGLNREHVYRMLSEEGNPSMINVLKVLKALGLSLQAAQTNVLTNNEHSALVR